jgi:probable F420-dependent oxidoreductase
MRYPWVALGSAASVTSRITLSTAVALPVESDPITLAKAIATLDHLSGGRVRLGVGFGWNTDELADHHVPAGKRRTVLREYLEAMRELWTSDEASYDGEFVSFGPSWAYPKPAVLPRVLVGAGGTDKTFDWIVANADGWINTPRELDVTVQVASLRRKWKDAGRTGDPEVVFLGGRPDPAAIEGLEAAGVTECAFGMPDKEPREVLAYLDRLAAKLRP